MLDFLSLLTDSQREEVEDLRRYREWLSGLSDRDLAVLARYYHLNSGCRFSRGSPVYDATLHYEILPELIRRVSEGVEVMERGELIPALPVGPRT